MCLSKPVEPGAETDQDAAELQEGEMDIRPSLIANPQAAEAREPREGPLHHPAVAAQLLAALDAAAGDARRNAPLPTRRSAVRGIIALVGVQLGGPPPRAAQRALDRRDRVQHRRQGEAIG